eukprot:2831697-Pyramimonas_sp.AAC.1
MVERDAPREEYHSEKADGSYQLYIGGLLAGGELTFIGARSLRMGVQCQGPRAVSYTHLTLPTILLV